VPALLLKTTSGVSFDRQFTGGRTPHQEVFDTILPIFSFQVFEIVGLLKRWDVRSFCVNVGRLVEWPHTRGWRTDRSFTCEGWQHTKAYMIAKKGIFLFFRGTGLHIGQLPWKGEPLTEIQSNNQLAGSWGYKRKMFSSQTCKLSHWATRRPGGGNVIEPSVYELAKFTEW
jgi:hypothetical protein